MTHCPCGKNKDYTACCGSFINNERLPDTPEQLMRSRYTAYSQANIDYIQQTMQGKAAVAYDPIQANRWASTVKWLGLTIIHSTNQSAELGFVEFIAHYKQQGKNEFIHEISEFHKLAGRWYYVDGKLQAAAKHHKQLRKNI